MPRLLMSATPQHYYAMMMLMRCHYMRERLILLSLMIIEALYFAYARFR